VELTDGEIGEYRLVLSSWGAFVRNGPQQWGIINVPSLPRITPYLHLIIQASRLGAKQFQQYNSLA